MLHLDNMQVSRYHKFLRVSLLCLTLVLLFNSGFPFHLTAQLSDNTAAYLGSVGSSAILSEEIDTPAQNANDSNNYSTYILCAALAFTIALMLINYIAHWLQMRKQIHPELSAQQ